MSADPALDLVCAYLRLNGYFLVTEIDLHVKEEAGFRTLTDIDVIAIRPPSAAGGPHYPTGNPVEECLVVTDIDPALHIDPVRFDVMIGEVKTAEATLNPALLTPEALHAALRRIGDLFSQPLDKVVDQLLLHGVCITTSSRVQVVAFGAHGQVGRGSTIHLRHAADFIRTHLSTYQDLYRVSRFSDPVLALLALLQKLPQGG